MPRRKTQAEYEQQVTELAPHVMVIGKYQGNRVKIAHYCTVHDIRWDVSPFNFLQHPNGCYKCQDDVLERYYNTRRKTDLQFRQEVEALGTNIVPMEEYKGTHERMPFMCKEGHIWPSTPHDVLNGYGCPFCAGNAVLRGYNDLWTTDPDLAQMLKNPNVGYEIGRGSHRCVDWICPDCGLPKSVSPKQVCIYGLACPRCSDGISYPNRFIISLLSQLSMDTFTSEWSPAWIGRCRYDAYFVLNGQEYVVEMDGGIGHGELDIRTNEPDTDGLARDMLKDEQARLHNIIVIRIDCKYEKTSIYNRFQYIKQSVLSSPLSEIFDLSHVDWELCNKDATKSLHMIAAHEYDSGKSIQEIADELHVHYSTIYNWLKRLAKENLCSYVSVLGAPSHKKNRNKVLQEDA